MRAKLEKVILWAFVAPVWGTVLYALAEGFMLP